MLYIYHILTLYEIWKIRINTHIFYYIVQHTRWRTFYSRCECNIIKERKFMTSIKSKKILRLVMYSNVFGIVYIFHKNIFNIKKEK